MQIINLFILKKKQANLNDAYTKHYLISIIFHLWDPLIRLFRNFIPCESPTWMDPFEKFKRICQGKALVRYRNYVHPRYPRSANDTDSLRGYVRIGLNALSCLCVQSIVRQVDVYTKMNVLTGSSGIVYCTTWNDILKD